jgi:hypothetical protein
MPVCESGGHCITMTLDKVYDLLNFLINKFQGGWYSPKELDLVVDRAQMSLFNSYYLEYSTSQRLNDAMGPFKRSVTFTNVDTPAGLYTVPVNYMHLLSLHTVVMISGVVPVQNRAVPILNEDEKVFRDNSQIIPVSVIDPYAVIVQNRNIQFYPAVPQAGALYYLSRPAAPVFAYSIISGRVVVYNEGASTQLEWADNDVLSIIVKALNMLGINMGEQDVLQWSENKDQLNIMSPKDKL